MLYNAQCDSSNSLTKSVFLCLHKWTHNMLYLCKEELNNSKKIRLMKDCCISTVNSVTWACTISSLERGNLTFACFSPSVSLLRQQTGQHLQRVTKNLSKWSQMSAASAEGHKPDCASSLVHPASAKGFVPHACYKFPGLGTFTKLLGEMLFCRTQGGPFPQEWLDLGFPCTCSSKAVLCTAGPVFRHLQLFN